MEDDDYNFMITRKKNEITRIKKRYAQIEDENQIIQEQLDSLDAKISEKQKELDFKDGKKKENNKLGGKAKLGNEADLEKREKELEE